MKTRIKWSLVTCLLVAVGLVSGCGGGHDNYTPATVQAKSTPITVTLGAAGTATTTVAATVAPPADAPEAVAKVAVTVLGATTITTKDAAGNPVTLTTAPTFTFEAPANATPTSAGTYSVPGPAGFARLQSAAVAIDVQITGAASSTFTNPITIVLPVPGKAPGTVVKKVYMNKNDGSTILVGGPFTVSAGTISVSVTDLLGWFVGDPIYETVTGSTGSTGSSGSNF